MKGYNNPWVYPNKEALAWREKSFRVKLRKLKARLMAFVEKAKWRAAGVLRATGDQLIAWSEYLSRDHAYQYRKFDKEFKRITEDSEGT